MALKKRVDLLIYIVLKYIVLEIQLIVNQEL